MTDHDAISAGQVALHGYKPSRHQAVLNKLGKLSRARGLSPGIRSKLEKASEAIEAGAPITALRILRERTST